MPTAADLIVVLFALTNGMRVLAFLPQIALLLRDRSGAAAVSCGTWLLFLVSNMSTAAYGAVVLDDRWMTLIFTGSSILNASIVALVLMRRHSSSARLVPNPVGGRRPDL